MTKGKRNDLLRRARVRRGWRQKDLAKALGVSDNTVRSWERGGHDPYPHTRSHLCKLFGMTPLELGLEPIDPPNEDLHEELQAPTRDALASEQLGREPPNADHQEEAPPQQLGREPTDPPNGDLHEELQAPTRDALVSEQLGREPPNADHQEEAPPPLPLERDTRRRDRQEEALKGLSSRRDQNRMRMIKRVRTHWISGFFNHSLSQGRLLHLHVRKQSEAVVNPWANAIQESNVFPQVFPDETRINSYL